MPPRYLALEESRLINLVTEWLRYESARVPFSVLKPSRKRMPPSRACRSISASIASTN